MAFIPQDDFDYSAFNGPGRSLADYQKALAQPVMQPAAFNTAPAFDFSGMNFGPVQSGWAPTTQRNPDPVQFKQVDRSKVQQPKSTTSSLSSRFSTMADNEDDEKKKDSESAEGESDQTKDVPLDDTPVLADAPSPDNPQIMTMAGPAPAPSPTAAPGGDPRLQRFGMGMGGMGGPMGGPGGFPGFGGMQGGPGGMHGGFLQQLFQRMQERRAQMQAQRQERMQQFLASPQGQQFAASPWGQRMQGQHPDWFPAAAAPAVGAAPAAGAPPATAANAAAAAAMAPPPAAAAAPAAAPMPAAAPQGRMRGPAQPMARPQMPQQGPATRFPTLGGAGANRALQDAMRRRNGGGMGGGLL